MPLIENLGGVVPPRPIATKTELEKAHARLAHNPYVGENLKGEILRDPIKLIEWNSLMDREPAVPMLHAWKVLGWEYPL